MGSNGFPRVSRGDAGIASDQVADFEFTPMGAEVFGDEPPMAMMGLVLAAQQAASLDGCRIDPLFDFALLHQIQKRMFIETPDPLVLFVGIEDVLGGREQGNVEVFDADYLLEKIRQVAAFRESGELRDIVEPHIDDPSGAALAEEFEKLGGRLLGEADGVDCAIRIHR